MLCVRSVAAAGRPVVSAEQGIGQLQHGDIVCELVCPRAVPCGQWKPVVAAAVVSVEHREAA